MKVLGWLVVIVVGVCSLLLVVTDDSESSCSGCGAPSVSDGPGEFPHHGPGELPRRPVVHVPVP